MSDEPEAVLDASAVLAVLNDEPGAKQVERLLGRAVISAVNLSETAGKLVDRGMREGEVRDALDGLQVSVHVFDQEAAFLAAEFRRTLPRSFSLGDRACLALARQLSLEAVTAEREWSRVKIQGVKVRVIR